MITDFFPDCEKCHEEVGTHPTKYNVNAPDTAAIRLGMMANYTVECDECGEITGGYLDADEFEYLATQMCNMKPYGVPSRIDNLPENLTEISKFELMRFSIMLARLTPRSTQRKIKSIS